MTKPANLPRYIDPPTSALAAVAVAILLPNVAASRAAENLGKQKVPTLRNVDLRPGNGFTKAYMHNGYFKTLEGEIINGIVQATGGGMITLGLDRKAEGIMPRNHQIRGERLQFIDQETDDWVVASGRSGSAATAATSRA